MATKDGHNILLPVLQVAQIPTAKDLACGMSVPIRPEAHQLTLDGVTYYFCCQGCRGKFNMSPRHYLEPPAATTSSPSNTKAASYICSMCPEVSSAQPGP